MYGKRLKNTDLSSRFSGLSKKRLKSESMGVRIEQVSLVSYRQKVKQFHQYGAKSMV